MQAKIIKLVGLKNGGRLSPINLVTFAGTQNGEYYFVIILKIFLGKGFYWYAMFRKERERKHKSRYGTKVKNCSGFMKVIRF